MTPVDAPSPRPRHPLAARLERRALGQGGARLTAFALLTGAGAGLGAVAFRLLIEGFTSIFSGHRDFSAAGHAINPHVPGLGIWFVVLAPVAGGLLYGPLVARFAPEARGHGVPEVMLAVKRMGGRMRPQVPIVKSLASALCIGSGGSVGREGPIVQIGSALGSVLGQAAKLPERDLRLLVACGAAGGISATFNAPIAGVFFSLELILRNFETGSFGLVVLSSVTADAIGRALIGSSPFLTLPPFRFTSAAELPLYALLGVLAVGVGLGFTRLLYSGEDAADRWAARLRIPDAWRPAAGGVLLGLLLLAVPQMYGVGYPVLRAGVAGHYALLVLVGLLAAKVLATSLTMWIGGSGGVFAPSLFMGAMLGTAFGDVAHAALPGTAHAAGAYGLVGMGAVFAAASRAPITGLLMIFELTGDYSIILPLMTAIVVATAVANLVTRDTIYTLKLRRRGIDLDAPAPRLMARMALADALASPPAALAPGTPLADVADRMAAERAGSLPVCEPDGHLAGIVAAVDVEHALAERGIAAATELTAAAVLRQAPLLELGATLEEAVLALGSTDADGLPVLDETGRLAGWIAHRDVLRAYRAGLTASADGLRTRVTPVESRA